MSRGINKWHGIGNCCNDPDVRTTDSGAVITSVTVACNEKRKDKAGAYVDHAEFIRVVFFNKLAEIAGQYLRKGSKVYVEGSLRTRKWQAQDGTDRYTTEIMGNEMQMLDSKQDGGAQNSGYAPQPQQRSAQAPQQSAPASYARPPQTAPQQDSAFSDFDDDIPY